MCEAGQGFALFEAGLNMDLWRDFSFGKRTVVPSYHSVGETKNSDKSIEIFKIININITAVMMSRSAVTLHTSAAMLCRQPFH